jgi:hypothetical protein
MDLLKQMEAAADKDFSCTVPGTKESAPCKLSLKDSGKKAANYTVVSFDLKSGEKSLASDSIFLMKSDRAATKSFTDTSSGLKYVVVPLDSVALAAEKQVVGQAYRGEFVLASIQADGFKFVGIYSSSAVIDTATVKDGAELPVCAGAVENAGVVATLTATTFGPEMSKLIPATPCY